MIYTQWGSEITIVANCGKYQPKGFRAPATLVRVRFPGDAPKDDWEGFRFVHTLKATDGINEIMAAVEKVAIEQLDQDTLKAAIREAL